MTGLLGKEVPRIVRVLEPCP